MDMVKHMRFFAQFLFIAWLFCSVFISIIIIIIKNEINTMLRYNIY